MNLQRKGLIRALVRAGIRGAELACALPHMRGLLFKRYTLEIGEKEIET
jgi:hypothetical protein